MKLETKLTLFNALSKLVIVILFVLLLPVFIKKISHQYVDNKLVKQKNKLLQIVKAQGIKDYIPDGEESGSYYLPLKEEYLTIENAAPAYFLDTIKNEKRSVEHDTIEYRILSHTFKLGNQNYLLEIGKSVDTLDETSTPLQNIAFAVLIGMILLTVLADQVYTDYVLRPLNLIIKTKLIGRKFPNFGSYKEVKTSTSDFKYLDLSIHQMVETIELAFQKEREFISNASHELMTPISILQSKIENMFEEEAVADDLKVRLLEMQKILNRLKSITKTLLLISQIENEQFLKEDSLPVAEMLGEIQEEISIRLQDKNITFYVSVPANWIFINVNKFLLFNLFFNLINNAIKYNKENGWIKITAQKENERFIINVADSGVGIDAANLPFIFNRFKKLKQSLQQDSFGLGLPIVKSIAGFHGIEIEVVSEKDEGSNFKLVFPINLIKTTIV